MGDIIVIAVLILCVALIIRNMIKTRKKGGCAGCSKCGSCGSCTGTAHCGGCKSE